jgi:hypothetical protein
MPSRLVTPFSQTTATTSTSSLKGKGKRSYLDAFTEDCKNDAQYSHDVDANKHSRKMAEHEQRMAELAIKRSRMDLEAQAKKLEIEERLITTCSI